MPETPPTLGLVLDALDPEVVARFWAEAIDYVVVGAAGTYTMLEPRGRPGPRLLIQQVAEAKRVKNRMHLDLDVPDIEVEAQRLEALGATRVGPAPVEEHATTWIVMADPEGNELCVCDGVNPPDLGQLRREE